MLDTVYMNEHNISNLNMEVRENEYLKFLITFKNGDELQFYVDEGYVITTVPNTIKKKVEDYEWKLLQKQRKEKIIKLNNKVK